VNSITRKALNEKRQHAARAADTEKAIYALSRVYKDLLTYRDALRGQAKTWTHAGSALVLVQREAEVAYDDLEFHLSKLNDDRAFYPEDMRHPPDVVACWACRRGPQGPNDPEKCVLGEKCRSAR
jgi:hypothetical protein